MTLINRTKHSAISILHGINWSLLIGSIVLSWIGAIALIFVVKDLMSLFKKGNDENLNDNDLVISYFIFSILVTYNLLQLLTVEQFELLATIIALPLFVIFPSLFRKISSKKNNDRKINKKPNDNNKQYFQ